MVEALIKIAGSLFVGGVGLAMIVTLFLFLAILIKEIYSHLKG